MRKSTLTLLALTAAVAVPAAGAMAPAEAATASQWDRVASCESGGNWSINTGNGFYGGLQFSRSTWSSFGGGAYAATADRASRAAQTTVGERVLASQGPGAWPVCGRGLLTRTAALARVQPVAHPTRRATPVEALRGLAPAAPLRRGSVHVVHVVVSGDSLSMLASRARLAGGWKTLYAANKRVIGSNPDIIRVQARLHVPA